MHTHSIYIMHLATLSLITIYQHSTCFIFFPRFKSNQELVPHLLRHQQRHHRSTHLIISSILSVMISGVAASSSVVLHLSRQSRQLPIPTMIKNQSLKLQPINSTALIKHKSRFLTQQTNPASFNPVICWKLYASMGSNNIPTPPQPNGSNSSLPTFIRCVIGVIVSLLQPFWKFGPGAKFAALGRQIEQTVNMVEHVAEIVEDVAEAVEKASSEMAKKLPEDGFLKEVVTCVEHISKEVADDAEDVIEFINKVEKVEEEIESIVEDVVEGKNNPKDQMENATMSQSISEEETKEKENKIEQANEEETKEKENKIEQANLVEQIVPVSE